MASSPTIIWARRVEKALASRDTKKLLELEKERLGRGEGMPLLKTGVLGLAARMCDEWGVETAMGFDTLPPPAGEVLEHFLSSRIIGKKTNSNRERVWNMIASIASQKELGESWAAELNKLDSDTWFRPPANWFSRFGVDVLAAAPMPGATNTPIPESHHPDRYALLPPEYRQIVQSQHAGREGPPRWAPLFACWCNNNPNLALELLEMGADAWKGVPDTLPDGWSLAGVMGLDPSSDYSPDKTSTPYSVRLEEWGQVKPMILEEKMEQAFPKPGAGPRKTRL